MIALIIGEGHLRVGQWCRGALDGRITCGITVTTTTWRLMLRLLIMMLYAEEVEPGLSVCWPGPVIIRTRPDKGGIRWTMTMTATNLSIKSWNL